MLKNLEIKYYNYELVEYLKSCSIEQLENIARIIKTNNLDKTGIKILGSVLFALENYNLITEEKEKPKYI